MKGKNVLGMVSFIAVGPVKDSTPKIVAFLINKKKSSIHILEFTEPYLAFGEHF